MELSEFFGDVEWNANKKGSSKHHRTSSLPKDFLPPGASQDFKLQDKLKTEKPVHLSDVNLHQEITQNLDNRTSLLPKFSGYHQKQRMKSTTTDKDELVKYMSNLPGYLQRVEKGGNLQEKALNFGVLDWRLLENWKSNQKQIPGRNSSYAPSTSSTSLEFSAVGSSAFSSRVSESPGHQRKQSTSLNSHLSSSPKETHAQSIRPQRNATAIQDFKITSGNPLAGQKKPPKTDQSYGKNCPESKLEKGKRKDSVLKSPGVRASSSDFKDTEVLSSAKGKMKGLSIESETKAKQLQDTDLHFADQQCPRTKKSIADQQYPETCSGICHSESAILGDGRSTDANRKSFSGKFDIDEVHFSGVYFDVPHSCPLPCGVESDMQADLKNSSSKNVKGVRSSDASDSLPNFKEVPMCQFEGNHVEESKPIVQLENSKLIEPSDQSNLKTEKVVAFKGRSSSPSYRFSMFTGRVGRSFSSKEGSAVPQLSSTYVATKSGPAGSELSTCPDSNRDKANANSRARSSPLKRLLDPLLRSKAANNLNSAEPVQDDSVATRTACKSSSAQPLKRNLEFSNCRAANVDDVRKDGKHESFTVPALLRITVKNGLPLFTFAVDGNNDFLAATLTKISTSKKDEYYWIYRFFSFSEMKKKNRGWISQGGKDKSCSYKSNVVGQMRVSTSPSLQLTKYDSREDLTAREFVLSGFGLKQADQGTPDFQANIELAAIIVKVPKETTEDLSNVGEQSKDYKDLSRMGLRKDLPNGRTAGNKAVFSTTVILPSAVHSLPSAGGPSSLIDRWKTGGSCDCGGWDVGCKLSILTDQETFDDKMSSSNASPNPDQIELHVQGGDLEKGPVFGLTPLKNGVYSVDFDDSISLLQAFSICIAVISGRESSDLSEVRSDAFREKTLLESMSMENDKIKENNQVQWEAPARYVSNPPLSPVGRA